MSYTLNNYGFCIAQIGSELTESSYPILPVISLRLGCLDTQIPLEKASRGKSCGNPLAPLSLVHFLWQPDLRLAKHNLKEKPTSSHLQKKIVGDFGTFFSLHAVLTDM